MVRVVAEDGRQRATAHVNCPVCGNEHPVRLMWRPTEEMDEGREADLVLPAVDAA